MGELAGLAAAFTWAVSICIYRRCGHGIGPAHLNFLKNIIVLGMLVPWCLFTLPTFRAEPSVLLALALSGIVGIGIGDTASFKALKYLSAHTTAVGLCLGPPVAAFLAFLTWGETLVGREWWGVGLTLAGVTGAVMFSQREVENRSALWGWGIFWVVVSGIAQGTGAVLGRHGLQSVDIAYGTVLRAGAANLFLLPGAMRFPLRAPGRQLAILSLGAFIGTGFGLVLMSIALKTTKAGVSTALMSTFPIFVIPVGRVILGEKASLASLLFTLLALAGIVLLVWKT